MIKTTALFGGVGSTIFCVYFWSLYALWGNPFLDLPKSVDFFIYLLCVAGSIAYLRFFVVGRLMSFWQGFATGVGVTMLMMFVSVIFVYFFTKSNPQALEAHKKERIAFFEKHKKSMIEHLDEQIKKSNNEAKSLSAEKIHQQKIDDFQKLTAWDMAYIEVSKLTLGFFIALVVALFLRK
jgi:hypothetical protein